MKGLPVKMFLGLLLLIISVVGIFLLRHYNGRLIPYHNWWFASTIVLGLIGAWILFSAIDKENNLAKEEINKKVEHLKSATQKIDLNFDKCEFKNGSYVSMVADRDINAVQFFGTTDLAQSDLTVSEHTIRSYFVYYDTINGQHSKFISQSFPFDDVTLKIHVLNHNISLYVDRFDKNKYFFDFIEA